MNKLILKFTVLMSGAGIAFAQAPAATSASATATNKPDIKEIFAKETFFTNAAGLVIQKISPELWVSRTEVTQDAFRKAGGGNPSAFPGGQNPVEQVSWNAAVDFCKTLTEYERKEMMLPEGFAYGLPTQAQWESFATGTGLDTAVTSANGSRTSTAPAGSLAANSLGLVDVRGNVWEWTADKNATYDDRVARGGAWNTSLEVELRPEFRVFKNPTEAANNIGFRVVLVPQEDAKTK